MRPALSIILALTVAAGESHAPHAARAASLCREGGASSNHQCCWPRSLTPRGASSIAFRAIVVNFSTACNFSPGRNLALQYKFLYMYPVAHQIIGGVFSSLLPTMRVHHSRSSEAITS